MMHVELQATCSALGYQEGNKYIREPDCLGKNLQDGWFLVVNFFRFCEIRFDCIDVAIIIQG